MAKSEYDAIIDDLINYTYRKTEHLLAQDIIEKNPEYAEALANELNAQLALMEDTVTLATEHLNQQILRKKRYIGND